jgi:DNA-binding IclR family transcriptional regulator
MSTSITTSATLYSVLSAFSEEHPVWTPEEMTEHLGLGRTALGRVLRNMREAGFLTLNANQTYAPGPRFIEMGYIARQWDPLAVGARPDIVALARRHPGIGFVARRHDDRVMLLAFEYSDPDAETDHVRGKPMPLCRGSAGRAVLAWLPRREQSEVVEANLAELSDIGLGHSIDEVLEALAVERRAGYVIAAGEITSGVTGIAAPIFDGGQRPVGSLGFAFSNLNEYPGGVSELGRVVARRAGDLSARLRDGML